MSASMRTLRMSPSWARTCSGRMPSMPIAARKEERLSKSRRFIMDVSLKLCCLLVSEPFEILDIKDWTGHWSMSNRSVPPVCLRGAQIAGRSRLDTAPCLNGKPRLHTPSRLIDRLKLRFMKGLPSTKQRTWLSM